jgi:hypothetical protein
MNNNAIPHLNISGETPNIDDVMRLLGNLPVDQRETIFQATMKKNE